MFLTLVRINVSARAFHDVKFHGESNGGISFLGI